MELTTAPELAVCPVCLERPLQVALQPCGHYLCGQCPAQIEASSTTARCPLCRRGFGELRPLSGVREEDILPLGLLEDVLPLNLTMTRFLDPLIGVGTAPNPLRRPHVNEDLFTLSTMGYVTCLRCGLQLRDRYLDRMAHLTRCRS